MPTGATTARAGLVCQYEASSNPRAPATPVFKRSTALDQDGAARLSEALSNVSLKKPSGTFHCPAQLAGTVTIIVLSCAQRDSDVDLWYRTSGCQSIDNGHVEAFQGGNPSFYDNFETVFRHVVDDR